MGRFSVEREPEVRAAVDVALANGATLDEIVARIRALGSDISRSSIGRYAQDYRAIADRQRDMSAVAKAFAADFGDAGDRQTRLLIQLGTTILTRQAMRAASADDDGDAEGMATKELADLARAIKDITSAAKVDADRDAKVREEARKQAKIEAAEQGEAAARSAGASDETIRRVRASILGIGE